MRNLGKEYYAEEIISIKKFLDEKDIKVLEKLGITVEDKIYTAFEYEIFSGEVSRYYKEDDYGKEDLEFIKSLEETGVSQEEYDELIRKMDKMAEIVYARKY